MPTPGPHPEATATTTDAARAGRTERDRRLLASVGQAVERTRELLVAGGSEAERFFHAGFEIAYDAYSRRDWELTTLLIDRDDFTGRGGAGQKPIDFRPQYHGIDGYLEAQQTLIEVWADVRIELDAVSVHPPDQVVTAMTWRGTAARGGVPMEWRCVSDNRFREGLNVMQIFWWDRSRAERDLGFVPPAPPSHR